MAQTLALVSLVVRDYDEALRFYVGTLGFELVEDSPVPEQEKRWVVIRPPGSGPGGILLARAAKPEQEQRVGNQTGGRVFLFLHTDDFEGDYARYRARGVEFVREPEDMPYGRVAVFRDCYGNSWDLVQPNRPLPPSERATPIIPATDLAVAKDFYVTKLGFDLLFEVTEDGTNGLLGVGRGGIRLTIDSPMEGHGREACVSLEVSDADRYHAEWSARIPVLRAPKDEPWGARTFDLLDPFGNTIFVMGPASEARPVTSPGLD